MQMIEASEVERRVRLARDAEPGGVIASDGDGTLWSGDVGDDLFHAMLERGPIRPRAQERLRIEAGEHAIDQGGAPADLARRIYDAYVAERFPEERVYELMAWIFAAWTRAELTAFVRDVLDRVGLVARLHREVTETVAWAHAEKIEVFLVSASPRAVVEEAARHVNISPSHVLAATPTWDDEGAMRAEIVRPMPYGPGKVGAIRAAIGARPIYAAFGDNAFDVAMLKEARVPVAVRPKDRLRDRAREVPHLVEIAPK